MKTSRYTRPAFLLLIAVFMAGGVTPASADFTLDFYGITNNNVSSTSVGENQLFCDVGDAGNNQVLFTFRNSGPYASAIAQIYFDDGTGTLVSIDGFTNSIGNVSFSQGASPSDLPGGNTVTPLFDTTSGLLAEADNPAPHKGVNPREQIGILVDLATGKSYSDVMTGLAATDFRIGLHVQDFDRGYSEGFINRISTMEPRVVPAPDTASLGLIGLTLVCWVRRRFA